MIFKDAIHHLENYFVSQRFANEHLDLYQPIKYILALDAKRFRPALLLMAFDLYSTNYKKALPAAFGYELFHNFTLMHDDIMDHAAIRRSKPATHVKFGVNNAILSGDAMMMLCYQYLLKSADPTNVFPIMELTTRTAIEICEGQSLDMDFEKRANVSVDEYLLMIKMKTAVLIAASLKLGGLLGGAELEDQNNLYNFGLNLGLAFQIQDDVLDSFGDQSKVGKEIGGDIKQKKKTFLISKAQELFKDTDLTKLNELFDPEHIGTQEEELWVIHALQRYEIDVLARQVQTEYYKKAMVCLGQIQSRTSKEHLQEVAKSLFKRAF